MLLNIALFAVLYCIVFLLFCIMYGCSVYLALRGICVYLFWCMFIVFYCMFVFVLFLLLFAYPLRGNGCIVFLVLFVV